MLTILLATHNGAATLPRVLDSYRHLAYPRDAWKLVVIDNASSDGTGALLAGQSGLPLSVHRTERRGKNVALNEGLAYVEGDLVVFTDDDAIAHSDWLAEFRRAADANPSYDVFAGAIEAVWPRDLPDWVERVVNLGATFGITPSDLRSGPVRSTQVWGANMAVRSSVFLKGHRFLESVGPAAGQYMMGSEVEFTCRIEREGHQAFFMESARVGHIIKSSQLDPQWIIQRGYRLGRHMFHQEVEGFAPGTAMWRGAPRWKWRLLADQHIRAMRARLRRDFEARLSAEWEISFLRGYLDEASHHADSNR